MDRVESLKVERFKNGFYYNYHKHTHYSNIRTQDCVSKPIDYIERAKELGHDSYFTTEHGCKVIFLNVLLYVNKII